MSEYKSLAETIRGLSIVPQNTKQYSSICHTIKCLYQNINKPKIPDDSEEAKNHNKRLQQKNKIIDNP